MSDVIDVAPAEDHWFDPLMLGVLSALLVFMPAAYGAMSAGAELVVFVGVSIAALVLAVKMLVRPDLRPRGSWAYVPIAVFVGFVLLQLVPLPASFVGAISPQTVELRRHLLSDLPDAAQRLAHVTISFYPEGTWHDLRIVLAVAGIFVVTLNAARRLKQITALMAVIAAVGAAEALLAVVQDLTHADGIYWVVPLWGNARPDGGSFVSHSIFSQFVNMAAGSALGLLLWKTDQIFRRRDYTGREVIEKVFSPQFKIASLLGGSLVLTLIAVFLSNSRGGVLSLAVAGLVTVVVLVVRGRARGMGSRSWLMAVVAVSAFCGLMFLGTATLSAQMQRLATTADRYDRAQLLRDTLAAWKLFPAVGTGFGTFRMVFAQFDHSGVAALATHAENEYAHLAMECGVVGVPIAASFLAMVVASYFRATSRGKRREVPGESGSTRHGPSAASSLAIGLGFGLVTVLVQSGTDFGQHFLADAGLTAMTCALLINVARLRREERGLIAEPLPSRGRLWMRLTALVATTAIAAGLIWQGSWVWMAARARTRAAAIETELAAQDWKGEDSDYLDLLHAAKDAADAQPNDAELRFALDNDRWRTISRTKDPATGQLVFLPVTLAQTKRLDDDLNAMRWLCPTFGPPLTLAGQLEKLYLGMPVAGALHLRMGHELARYDADAELMVAQEDAAEGYWKESEQEMREAVHLDGSLVGEVVNTCVNLDRPDAALAVAQGNAGMLRQLAEQLREHEKAGAATAPIGAAGGTASATGPATREAVEAIAARAEEEADRLLEEDANKPDASAETLATMAQLCVKRRQDPAAARYFDMALKRDYGQIEWRLQYAKVLIDLGQNDEALHQARIVLHQRPGMEQAQALVDSLSPKPAI